METVEIECRCKDCFFGQTHKGQLYCRVWEWENEHFTIEVNPEDFCSYGEKRVVDKR